MSLFKKRYYILHSLAVMLAALILVTILVLISFKGSQHHNRFNRKFTLQSLSAVTFMARNKKIMDISSVTSNSVYFQTYDPATLIKSDSHFKAVRVLHFPIKETQALTSMFITRIDSPFVYVAGGNIPVVIQVNIYNHKVQYFNIPAKTFSRCIQVSDSSFVFRMFKNINGKWNQIFVKNNMNKNEMVEENNISEKTNDAGFSTDGLLHYDSTTKRLIYVHYYDNSIICMDTNLNLLYRATTIDTNHTRKISITDRKAGANSEFTNASPIRDVNLQSCVSDGRLYVNSNFIADNEILKQFKNESVIDVYSILNKSYEGSFYIPMYKQEKIQSFSIYKNLFYALYADWIVLYQMNN